MYQPTSHAHTGEFEHLHARARRVAADKLQALSLKFGHDGRVDLKAVTVALVNALVAAIQAP